MASCLLCLLMFTDLFTHVLPLWLEECHFSIFRELLGHAFSWLIRSPGCCHLKNLALMMTSCLLTRVLGFTIRKTVKPEPTTRTRSVIQLGLTANSTRLFMWKLYHSKFYSSLIFGTWVRIHTFCIGLISCGDSCWMFLSDQKIVSDGFKAT